MSTTYRVTITRKPGLSDPEGTTTKKALEDLGFSGIEGVSFGRVITIEMSTASTDALETIEAMCDKLLANPVMESYTIEALS